MPLILGLLLFALIVGGSLYAIWRSAARSGIALPIGVAFGVRLAVMIAVDVTSRLTGSHGFLYLDEHGYAVDAARLAHRWAHLHPGNLVEPLGVLPHGGPLFYQVIGLVFLMTGNSVFAMKLLDVVIGTATVLFAAKLSRHVIGEGSERRAAWVVALAPPLIWWSVTILREPLAAMLAIASLLTAASMPRWRAVVSTSLLLAALALTRSTLFAAVAGGILCWAVVAAVRRRGRPLLPQLRAIGVVLATTLAIGAFLATGGGSYSSITALPSQSISSFQSFSRSHGNMNIRDAGLAGGEFDSPIAKSIAHGTVLEYLSAGARFFLSPRPWAFAEVPFDWLQPLYPMMWLLYFLIPTALAGAWALRRRPEVLLAVVPTVLLAALYAVALDSGVRQRSGVEPLLALLVVAGASSRRFVVVSGSLVLVGISPVVAVDLGNPLDALPVLAAGCALFAYGIRMPRRRGQHIARQPDFVTPEPQMARSEVLPHELQRGAVQSPSR